MRTTGASGLFGIAATVDVAGTPAPDEPEGFAGAGGRGEGEGPALG